MKNFKLISDADDSYHIQHANGKSFTVMKKDLSEKAHAEIRKLAGGNQMAEGGMIQSIEEVFGRGKGQTPDPNFDPYADPTSKYVQQNKQEKSRQRQDVDSRKNQQSQQAGFAEGGEVPAALEPSPAPDIGKVAMQNVGSPQNVPSQQDFEMSQKRDLYNQLVPANLTNQPAQDIMFGPNGEAPKNFSPYTWQMIESNFDNQKMQEQAALSEQYKQVQSENQMRQKAGLEQLALPEMAQATGQNVPAPTSMMQQKGPYQFASVGGNQPAGGDPMLKYFQQQNESLQKQQQDVGKYVNTLDQNQQAQNQYFSQYFDKLNKMETPQEIYARHDTANKELLKNIMDNKVDPNRYMHNMSTGSKIIAGIAMVLGGAGAGRNGVNLAAQHIDSLIQRDIDAQVNDQSKNMSLYKMNREHANDEVQARLMTQNQMMTMVQAKLAMAGAATSNAERRLNASNMVRQLQSQIDANNLQLGLSGGSSGPGQPGGLSPQDPAMLVPIMAKMRGLTPEQQKVIYDQIDHAKTVSKNKHKIMEAFDQSAKESSSASSMAGYKPGSVSKLHQMVLPLFSDIDGTVRESAQNETFENITPKWNDTAERKVQRRQALEAWLDSKTQGSAAKGAGINLENFSATAKRPSYTPQQQSQQQFVNYIQANKSNPDPQVQKRVQFLSNKLGIDLFNPNKKQAGF